VSPRARRGRDGIEVSLDDAEAALLGRLAADLRTLLGGEGVSEDDPVRARLYPRAYLDPTEDKAEADWQQVVHGELVRERLAALDALTGTLAAATPRRSRRIVRLGPDDAERWLSALNDARLALGTRLGVTEDLAPGAVAVEDRPGYEIYTWLTYLQGQLLELMAG
jgi:Domain of unknown function (DUF2017)